MRRFTGRSALILLLALTAGACSRDPEQLKREYVAEGDRYLADGKNAEAIVAFRNAVAQDAKFGEGRSKLAGAYLANSDYPNALREAVRAADLLPKDATAQLRATRLLLAAGRYEDAKSRVTAFLAVEPKNAEALVLLGNALAGLKDLDAAITQVEAAIDQDPQRTLSYANLGFIQIAKGNREAAESAFKRAVEVAPRSSSAHMALGNYYWAAGRAAEAERELKAAYEIDRNAPEINRNLAAFYIGANRTSEAELHLKAYADGGKTLGPKLLLVDHYVRVGKNDDAVKLLDSLRSLPDASAPVAIRHAALDFRLGRRVEAYRWLDDVLKQDPTNQVVLEMKARLLLAERKFEEARVIAASLVDANSKSLSGQYLLGASLAGLGSDDKAKAVFQALLQQAPTSTPVRARLAELHLSGGNAQTALQLAIEVVKAQPRSVPAHLLHGKALLRAGDIKNAERELTAVARVIPESAEVHAWLGVLHEAKNDRSAARAAYEKAQKLDPESDFAFAGLVNADFADRNLDGARARVETRLQTAPRSPAVLRVAGTTYTRLRDFAKAEQIYRTLLEVDPNSLQAYGSLAAIYVSQQRLDDARRMFEEGSTHQEKPVAAKTMIGMLLTIQKKHKDARKYYEEALALDPRAGVAANNLAWDYAESGENLNVALQLAQMAKSQLPDNGQVNDTLGWVYYKSNLFPQAVTELRDAAAKRPTDAGVHYRLGLAQIKVGNYGEARRNLQQVIKLDPQLAQSEKVPQLIATIAG